MNIILDAIPPGRSETVQDVTALFERESASHQRRRNRDERWLVGVLVTT
jgi:hypothetical protein